MGPVPVEFVGAEKPDHLDQTPNTHEVEYESEPEGDPVRSERCRVVGVSCDGEDNAIRPRRTVNLIHSERCARVRRPLCGQRRRSLHAVHADSEIRCEPRLSGPGTVAGVNLRCVYSPGGALRPANIFRAMTRPQAQTARWHGSARTNLPWRADDMQQSLAP